MISRLIATIVIVAAVTSAWADHGGGLSSPERSPVVTALLWAGTTLLAGIAVITIVRLWSRRRSPPPPEA